MALIYLSLGSNIERHRRIGSALDALADNFGELIISSVYESESVGFTGDSFYNLVVGIRSSLTVAELLKKLKDIENQNGRDRSAPRFGSRSLDIDILAVDQLSGEVDGVKLPRDEVLKNALYCCLWPKLHRTVSTRRRVKPTPSTGQIMIKISSGFFL